MTDRAEWDIKWRNSEKGKATQRRYKTSEKAKATKRAYQQSPEGRAQQARERAALSPERRVKAKGSTQRWRAALKHDALVAYSQEPPACTCCGETIEAFLVIDHINGDGRKHRASKSNFYNELRKTGYPKDPALQVLCCNCNWGKQVNGGICPHQSTKNLPKSFSRKIVAAS